MKLCGDPPPPPPAYTTDHFYELYAQHQQGSTFALGILQVDPLSLQIWGTSNEGSQYC